MHASITKIIFGTIISQIGDWLLLGAIAWALRKPEYITASFAAFSLGVVVSSLGLSARRVVRPRRQAVVSNLVLAVLSGLLAMVVHYFPAEIELFYVVNFALGMTTAFQRPAEASVFATAGAKSLFQNVTMLEGMRSLARASVGLFIGLFVENGGPELMLILNSASFVSMAYILYGIGLADDHVEIIRDSQSSALSLVHAVLKKKGTLVAIAIQATSVSFGLISLNFLPAMARDSSGKFGVLLAVGPIGAFLGTLLASYLLRSKTKSLFFRAYAASAIFGAAPLLLIFMPFVRETLSLSLIWLTTNFLIWPSGVMLLALIGKEERKVTFATVNLLATTALPAVVRFLIASLLTPVLGDFAVPGLCAAIAVILNAVLVLRFKDELRQAFVALVGRE